MHGNISEFNRVIFELRSAHLYPELEIITGDLTCKIVQLIKL